MNIKPINEKKDGDRPYIAGYLNQKIGLYAKDLWAAKQLAVTHFKPSKKNSGLLWVELAEE
ncbi:hypothetical protein HYP85_gp043 [Pseudomonas phage Zuri]|uniref:ATP binding protein n=1 Tax=Pseudomonas phage Zuri TaxID=2604899 RepID=A0A5C1K5B7_9CAUD|nr:hypothetical protein HYP85_gp043 [Pseudomonas phage Zuri]QEM41140.1 ATP binding protein [Pseudomonas phage Zuri]